VGVGFQPAAALLVLAQLPLAVMGRMSRVPLNFGGGPDDH
jgi:hypothetical protein